MNMMSSLEERVLIKWHFFSRFLCLMSTHRLRRHRHAKRHVKLLGMLERDAFSLKAYNIPARPRNAIRREVFKSQSWYFRPILIFPVHAWYSHILQFSVSDSRVFLFFFAKWNDFVWVLSLRRIGSVSARFFAKRFCLSILTPSQFTRRHTHEQRHEQSQEQRHELRHTQRDMHTETHRDSNMHDVRFLPGYPEVLPASEAEILRAGIFSAIAFEGYLVVLLCFSTCESFMSRTDFWSS